MTALLPQEIIRKKRDREPLSPSEIEAFIGGVSTGSVGEGQIAALAMAVFLNGMRAEETIALTLAMRDSGRVLDWSDLPGPALDKHSTGGVGDKVSLVLAPLLAAVGAHVPMISGRGLGHTGGTLDKLESIPGYQAMPDLDRFRAVVRDAGCAIVGATADLAPADKRIYAVRDVTGTVESLPLITASILSKKLAAGPSALVMDVKTGSGAFMAAREDARALARSIVDVACGAGLPTTALLTDMNQCLGHTAGNALEVEETLAFLRGEKVNDRLVEVTLALAEAVLERSGLVVERSALERAISSGQAMERFERMCAGLGVDGSFWSRGGLPTAPVRKAAMATRRGRVAGIDTRALGMVVVGLGGGRVLTTDQVDHAVGLSEVAGIGVEVEIGDPLAIVHARTEADADQAIASVTRAFSIEEGAVEPPPTILERFPIRCDRSPALSLCFAALSDRSGSST